MSLTTNEEFIEINELFNLTDEINEDENDVGVYSQMNLNFYDRLNNNNEYNNFNNNIILPISPSKKIQSINDRDMNNSYAEDYTDLTVPLIATTSPIKPNYKLIENNNNNQQQQLVLSPVKKVTNSLIYSEKFNMHCWHVGKVLTFTFDEYYQLDANILYEIPTKNNQNDIDLILTKIATCWKWECIYKATNKANTSTVLRLKMVTKCYAKLQRSNKKKEQLVPISIKFSFNGGKHTYTSPLFYIFSWATYCTFFSRGDDVFSIDDNHVLSYKLNPSHIVGKRSFYQEPSIKYLIPESIFIKYQSCPILLSCVIDGTNVSRVSDIHILGNNSNLFNVILKHANSCTVVFELTYKNDNDLFNNDPNLISDNIAIEFKINRNIFLIAKYKLLI